MLTKKYNIWENTNMKALKKQTPKHLILQTCNCACYLPLKQNTVNSYL